jgi:hypothetical protein
MNAISDSENSARSSGTGFARELSTTDAQEFLTLISEQTAAGNMIIITKSGMLVVLKPTKDYESVSVEKDISSYLGYITSV